MLDEENFELDSDHSPIIVTLGVNIVKRESNSSE